MHVSGTGDFSAIESALRGDRHFMRRIRLVTVRRQLLRLLASTFEGLAVYAAASHC